MHPWVVVVVVIIIIREVFLRTNSSQESGTWFLRCWYCCWLYSRHMNVARLAEIFVPLAWYCHPVAPALRAVIVEYGTRMFMYFSGEIRF